MNAFEDKDKVGFQLHGKKEKTKQVTPEKAVMASDEKWMKHWEKRHQHITGMKKPL